ncbi:MAG: DMT family transporter [Candidatus Taylorbacteria bacterium]|nr:DMT family transporter [Candidatus Taylorbacteria bacterium]
MKLSLQKYAPFLIFFAAMLWATDAPFRMLLTEDLPSNFIVLGEHFFDILIAVPILFLNWTEVKKLSFKGWLSIIFVAVCGSALASVAFTEAFHYVNPSVAILLQKLQPFIAIGLAVTFLQERLPKRFWLWTGLAVIAAYVISFPDLVPRLYEGEVFNPNFVGVSLALGAALFWGVSTVLGKYALETVSFKTLAALRFALAFLFLLGLNAYQGTLSVISSVTGRDWLFIFIIAVTSGIVSLFIYYKGLSYTKASVATVAELGFPLAAVIINAVFIDAPITLVQVVGMVGLLSAIYFLTRFQTEPVTVTKTVA